MSSFTEINIMLLIITFFLSMLIIFAGIKIEKIEKKIDKILNNQMIINEKLNKK